MSDQNSTGAILIHLEYIKDGIDGLKEGQLVQGIQLRQHGEAIAVLQDRANESRIVGARWGAGIGAGMAALTAGLWQWLGSK